MTVSTTKTQTLRPSTDGVSSPEVTLWPYAPGVYGRDALHRVWSLMEAEGATKRVFWERAMTPETAGDLASFIKTFDGVPSTQLALVSGEEGSLIGCIWVSDVTPGHQAFISIWMSKAGLPYSMEASRKALDYSFTQWSLAQLWAVTPWHRALALAVRLGFKKVGTMPAYCRWPSGPLDVHILRLTKEQWYGTI